VRAILPMFSAVANLTFLQEFFETQLHYAELRYAASDAHPRGFAYFPAVAPQGGDAWFNKSSGKFDDPVRGNYAFHTFIHETGHALGLKHPHEARGAFGIMPSDQDSLAYSVMSYRSYVGASTAEYVNGTWDYPQTLMMHDIRAIQQLYGANFDNHFGPTTYRWDPNSGQIIINGCLSTKPHRALTASSRPCGTGAARTFTISPTTRPT
jgi:serralysin